MNNLFIFVLFVFFVSIAEAARSPTPPASNNGSIGNFRFQTEKDQNQGAMIQKQEQAEKRNLQQDLEKLEKIKERKKQARR